MPAIQHVDYLAIAPPLILALAALAVLVAAAFLPARHSVLIGTALVATLAALGADIALATGVLGAGQPRRTFCVGGSCSYVVDSFTLLFQIVMLVAGIVVLLMAVAEVRDTQLPVGEFSVLLLITLSGAVTLAAGRDLVTLVVALEVVSLPLFALVALRRYDGRSTEAGLKMFLVSVISTAVMLFGVALVYGVTGSLFLDRIASALARPGPLAAVAAVGVVFVLVGFGFKIAVVPFHFWAPDTYQGAPVAVAAFLSVVSKAAGFAGRVLVMTHRVRTVRDGVGAAGRRAGGGVDDRRQSGRAASAQRHAAGGVVLDRAGRLHAGAARCSRRAGRCRWRGGPDRCPAPADRRDVRLCCDLLGDEHRRVRGHVLGRVDRPTRWWPAG
jgi:NADH:ubiquinone oxidoreductase subunit 2 (subunit N)